MSAANDSAFAKVSSALLDNPQLQAPAEQEPSPVLNLEVDGSTAASAPDGSIGQAVPASPGLLHQPAHQVTSLVDLTASECSNAQMRGVLDIDDFVDLTKVCQRLSAAQELCSFLRLHA
jgi:hypothetical protein